MLDALLVRVAPLVAQVGGPAPIPGGGTPIPQPGPPPPPSGGGGGGGSSGSFLVSPQIGLMIWTLLTFVIVLLILRRYAFPRIAKALDERRRSIEESIDEAERSRREAEELLEQYRGRLKEAREQSEEIVDRARKNADQHEEDAKQQARQDYEDQMEKAKRDIEQETRRALDEIRREMAELTMVAAEKVTRRSLDDEDHRELVEEALQEADFSRLSAAERGSDGGDRNGSGSSS